MQGWRGRSLSKRKKQPKLHPRTRTLRPARRGARRARPRTARKRKEPPTYPVQILQQSRVLVQHLLLERGERLLGRRWGGGCERGAGGGGGGCHCCGGGVGRVELAGGDHGGVGGLTWCGLGGRRGCVGCGDASWSGGKCSLGTSYKASSLHSHMTRPV